MATHKYNCHHCKFEFSFESEEKNELAFSRELGGINCPKCKRKRGEKGVNITHVFMVPGGRGSRTRDKGVLRKENAERSALAARQAAEYRANHPDEFAEVSVSRPKDTGISMGNIQRGNAVENVPKKVVDGLAKIAEAGIKKSQQ